MQEMEKDLPVSPCLSTARAAPRALGSPIRWGSGAPGRWLSDKSKGLTWRGHT